MKIVRWLLFAFCLSARNQLHAQVPQLINFQGRVAVDGVNFDGAGQFKFVLVNGEGNASFWSNDGTSIYGSEPNKPVLIPVSQGLYSVLLGDATLTNMWPISASIFTNSDVRLRIWFNDGTNGFQQLSPDQRIAAVGYAMMAANVADGVVTSAKLADGAVTSGKLAIGAVAATNLAPHSIGPAQLATNAAADSLRDSGGLVLSDQSKATALLNAGYVRIGQVTTDVDYWRQVGPSLPTPRWGHSAIWTGSEMIIWGGRQLGMANNLNTGARYNPVTDTWTPIATNNAPAARMGHTAVWTGTEMIVWGGTPFSQAGGRYNPNTDQWRTTTAANAPNVYADYRAVWTGTEMIVWAGPNLGGRYNPSMDSWRNISTLNAPTDRSAFTAVWTGNRMIIWGGLDSAGPAQTGGIYDPTADAWVPTTTNGAPAPRYLQSAVFTANEMVIWGGQTINYLNTGARYNPGTDRWFPVSVAGAPTSRSAHTAIWTGAEMIIWGGRSGGTAFATGGRYDPVLNRWLTLTTNAVPSPRTGHSMVWSGNEAIIWGGTTIFGQDSARGLNTGARYNPLTDSWLAIAANPTGRTNHTAVWTGAEMIVWGGQTNSNDLLGRLNTGARFNLATGRWTPTSLLNAPTPRSAHTAVWTGNEMIVWGGVGPSFRFNEPGPQETKNNGGRYNPARDLWSSIETNEAPVARTSHTAIWTGHEMIVWGGTTNPSLQFSASSLLNSGGRYDPDLNAWTSMASSGAPTARFQHSAAWTGDEMIVWGGIGLATTNVPTQPAVLNTGARYFPNLNAWIVASTNGAPSSFYAKLPAVWTGKEMIVGRGRYNPSTDSWLPVNANGAPPAVPGFSAVWTGGEMIVWGGAYNNPAGGRYSPDTDAWTGITVEGMPTPRSGHTAVWTGTGMLIFGGTAPQQGLPDTTYLYSLTKPMYLYRKP